MAQDYYTTKQFKSENIPSLNTRGITNCQHFAPLNVCSLGYSAGKLILSFPIKSNRKDTQSERKYFCPPVVIWNGFRRSVWKLHVTIIHSQCHKKRILIVIHLNTALHRIQARSQVLKFGGAKYILGGHDFCFYHIFNTNFLGTSKFGGYCPRMPPPPVATGLTVFDLFSEDAHSFFCRMFC